MPEKKDSFKLKREFLKNYTPFSSLSNNLLKKIVSRLQVHHYGAGQIICERGKTGNSLYIIHTGSVIETLADNSTEEITVAILREGDCFGTISLLTDEPYLATIKVNEDVKLYVLYKNDLEELTRTNPVLSTYLNRIISIRIKTFLDFFEREKIKIVEGLEDKLGKERKLDVISRVTKLFYLDEDINKTLSLVVKEVNQEMKADACSIYLLDTVSNNLILKAAVGFDHKAIKDIKMRLDEGITGWVVRNCHPIALEDARVDPRMKFISEIHEDRLCSLLSVPLGDKKDVIGAINIQTINKRKYTYEDIRGLTILANHITLAISHERLKRRIQIAEQVKGKKDVKKLGFVGKGKYIDKINSFVDTVATHDEPILIGGEDGTGKIPMSKIIHYKSKRCKGPFVEVDCRDIDKDSWGEELFGRERSSYIISCDDAIKKDSQDKESSENGIEIEDIATRLGYIELADSGTVFLNHVGTLNQANQIKLLNYLQEGRFRRVNGSDTVYSNARIVASADEDITELIEKGRFDRNLYSTLGKNFIYLKALRNQKRSIPMLTKHFLKKISEELHKDVRGISDNAIERLFNYDWPGNVDELESVLRRAVILAKDDTVTAEQIFFGIKKDERKWSFDILSVNTIKEFLKSKFYPLGLQIITSALLVIILCLLFTGHRDGLLNFANVFLWSAGYFSIYLLTLISGRSFCGICPFAIAGDWVQRLKSFNLQIPKVLINYGRYITIGMILTIFWFEGITLMPRSSTLTAFLIIFILSGAMISGFLFERRVWCRYVCPLGNLLGIYSLSSAISLKANRNVCLNQCETHDCYLGTKSVKGCPMFLHPYSLESSKDCVFCMNCYKNCGYSSIKVNLQLPGTDVSELSNRSLADSMLSMSLLGVLLVEYGSLLSIDSQWFQSVYNYVGINQSVLFTLIFIFVSASPFVSIGFIDYLCNGFSFVKTKERMADFGYAAIPLALMGHLAFYWDKLKTNFWRMLEIANIYKTGKIENEYSTMTDRISSTASFELLTILLGFAGSTYFFYLISKKTKHILTKSTIAGYFTVFAIFTLIYIYIL
jgi:transcriptional regulator with GAF, ATPase, and Fis domain/polyferredoxin